MGKNGMAGFSLGGNSYDGKRLVLNLDTYVGKQCARMFAYLIWSQGHGEEAEAILNRPPASQLDGSRDKDEPAGGVLAGEEGRSEVADQTESQTTTELAEEGRLDNQLEGLQEGEG